MVRGLAILVLIYLAIVYGIPRPAAIAPDGWRLLGIFTATVSGLILQPVPGGALVLTAVTLCSILAGMKIEKALSGYSEPNVWLVLAAFFISRALLKTGLARRIALFFVRRFGSSSLGVCYALSLSDMVLATIVPSNGARSGGVTLPIARSIAELYGSKPGATAGLLGSFLMTAVYQSVCVSSAMFYTGQASNPIAATMATKAGFTVTWSSWFLAGIVPGLCSLFAIPWIIQKMNPPEICKTPEASAFAARELAAMGLMSTAEWILAAVFAVVCGFWITSGWHKIDITVTALIGSMALLLTGVLTWEDVKNEKSAWDLFIWYGGVVMMGKALNEANVATVFANFVAGAFSSTGWVTLFVFALLIYFYAHYAFASITAHLLAMFPAFLAVLLAKGAPIGLTVFAFACFVNFAAGLTNYGTTPAPMFFAQDYVSLQRWWKTGLIVSFVNIAIWSTVGFAWWKLIGIW
jgi:DASS family divalent anion:Na+ symporter